jgi:hypothetical protein
MILTPLDNMAGMCQAGILIIPALFINYNLFAETQGDFC